MKKYEVDPLTGKIVPKLIMFSLPLMGISLLESLFSLADTWVISRFGLPGSVTAIGSTNSISILLVYGLLSLSTGVSYVCGKAFGEKDSERIHKIANTLPLSGFVVGLVMAILVIPFLRNILVMMNCLDSIIDRSQLYLSIYLTAAPFIIVFNFLTALLSSKGNTTIPLVYKLLSGLLNLCLNLVFVIGLNLDVAGVGLATLLSQMIATAALLYYLTKQDDEIKINLKELTLFKEFGDIWRLGIPACIEGTMLNISAVMIQAAINSFPEEVITGSTYASAIEGIMVVTFMGFQQAGLVFVSQNYGNRNLVRVKQVFVRVLLLVLCVGEVTGISIYLCSNTIFRMFTDNPVYIHYAVVRLRYIALFHGLCGSMNTLSGCVHGLGSAKIPTLISFIGSVLFRISWIYLVAVPRGSLELLYTGFPLCWTLITTSYIIAFTWLYKKIVREAELGIE